MKTCEHCGKENDEAAKFCESCGQKVELEKNVSLVNPCGVCHKENAKDAQFCEHCGNGLTSPSPEQPVNVVPKKETQPPKQPVTVTKKQKILGVLVVLLAVVGIGGYKFFETQYSKEKQIEAILSHITKKEEKGLKPFLTTEDKSLELTTETIKPLLTYYDHNKDDVTELKKAMERESSYNGLKLVQQGKKALFFDKYMLDVSPVYTNLIANVPDTIVELNGKEFEKTKGKEFSKKVGPFIPGDYTFTAKNVDASKKEMSLESTYTLLPGDETSDIDMSFILVSIPIESNIPDATILVDGKEAGTLSKGKGKVGPILWNNKLTLQLMKKTDAGELKTDIEEIKRDDIYDDEELSLRYLEFDVLSESDVRSGLRDFYSEFSNLVDTDYTYNAEDFANTYYINGSKNESFKGINDYINWCRDRAKKNEYDSVNFDLDVKSVTPVDNDKYRVTYNVVYNTWYPYTTKKDKRVEGFDYTDVLMEVKKDTDDYSYTIKFENMGDGGKKVYDNHANE